MHMDRDDSDMEWADDVTDHSIGDGEELSRFGDLFEDDAGDMPLAARRALTGLLSKPSVSSLFEPELYRLVLAHEAQVRRDLNNLGLTLTVSERYGVAWASQAAVEGASPLYTLKRSMRLRRDQTVVLVRLRVRQHAAETRGEEHWFFSSDELVEEVADILYPDSKDRARASGAVARALADLEGMGYVRSVRGSEDSYQILPVLPASLSLERTKELVLQMQKLVAEGNKA